MVVPSTTSGVLDDVNDGALVLGCAGGAVAVPVGCGVEGGAVGVDADDEGADGAELGADVGFVLGAEAGVVLGFEVGPPMLIPMIGPPDDGLEEGVVLGVVGVSPASATLLEPVVLSWFAVPVVAASGLKTPFTVVPSQVSGSHQVTVEVGVGVVDGADDGEVVLAAEPELAGALGFGVVLPVGVGFGAVGVVVPVGVPEGPLAVGWVGAPTGGAVAAEVGP
ncbi:MAG: hypothetical protein HOV87_24095, partial [Catenulispora sp.]|nr:hypothetical protein [Catenulispora sp.]